MVLSAWKICQYWKIMLLIYTDINKGPRVDSWGTLLSILGGVDLISATIIWVIRCNKAAVIYQCDLLKKKLWQTILKAFKGDGSVKAISAGSKYSDWITMWPNWHQIMINSFSYIIYLGNRSCFIDKMCWRCINIRVWQKGPVKLRLSFLVKTLVSSDARSSASQHEYQRTWCWKCFVSVVNQNSEGHWMS